MAQGIVENQLHDLTLAEAATLLYIMCNICNIFESRVVVEQSTHQNKTKFLALTVCVISISMSEKKRISTTLITTTLTPCDY